jgi:hypothetical protein
MPTPDQGKSLLDAVSEIRSAQGLLREASYATSDVAVLIKINTTYTHLDSVITQMLHAQTVTDDVLFAGTVNALKQEASKLAAEEAQVRSIIADVNTAAKIVGYIGQAVGLLAGL